MKEIIKETIKNLEIIQAEILGTCEKCGGVNIEDVIKCKHCNTDMDYDNNENASEIQNTISLLNNYI